MPLLDIKNLSINFNTLEGTIRAVQGVGFSLEKGEIVGIVGESGCGKSVTVRSILRLLPMPPGEITQGEIMFNGENLLNIDQKQLQAIRGRDISMIFQEPMTSLNPVFTIGNQILETFKIHQKMDKRQAREAAIDILKKVSIPSPEKRFKEYPHQLSGGMRQRVMIAMALACQPKLLIADEPTTALDVTVQAQILDLMVQLSEQIETSILLITHDLGIVAQTASRVIVMYAGKIIESGSIGSILKHPLHPYTIGLIKSMPQMGKRSEFGKKPLHEIPGMVPGLDENITGCWFAPRCDKVMDICKKSPPLQKSFDDNHSVNCWLFKK